MGKECTVVWGSRMKTGMCEELDVTGLARLLEMQGRTYDDNCEVQTLHLLQNDGHADSLKATAKEKLLLTGSTYCHSTDSTSIQSMAPSSSENEDTCNRQNCCNSDMAQDIASNDTQSLIQHGVSKNGKASVVCNGSSYNIESRDVCPGDTSSVNRDQGLLQHVHSNDSSSVSEIAGVKDLSNGHGNSHSDSCLNTDLHVNEQGTQDVSVNVGMTNNSRLSRVLENIPLVYIPTTRQLGLMEDVSSIKQVRTHSENNNSEILSNPNCKNAYENVGKDEHKVYRHCESVSIDDDVECVSLNRHYETEYTDTNTCNTKSTVRDGSVKADNTSFSSVSSISTGPEVSWAAPNQENADVQKKTVGGDEDSDFMEINLHSRNSYEPTRTPVEESLPEEIHDSHDNGARPKKKSLSGFLSRNLFSRKPKDGGPGYESAPGWKLFGRIPPKECEKKGANQVLEDYQARHRPHISETRKKQDIEVLSTTALILENRPMNLPSKCPEEELRHKQEYEAMVEAAKKKELKEIRQKKKYLQQQLKTEDKRVACARYWNNEVLPNWDNMHNHKKTRELWWLGLPPNVRGKVWKLAIGNDLNITSELYEICLSRAKDKMNLFDMEPKDPSGPSETSSEPPSNKEASVELIKLDVARTFPQLCIFQKGGPYYELLHSLLGAYACYRPDVGYVQGMSFIAAVLLLNMDVADAFICFTNLLNKPCQVAFFRMDESLMKSYFQSFEEFFKENMPILHEHFIHLSMTPEVYIIDWMFTLFSKSLPLDVACRVWDVFCRDGEEFLFRTALGLLKMHEDILIQLDFIHLAQFMTKLPDIISGEKLFRSIESVKMTIDKKRFIQVLASFRDAS